jgi:hypothetical protein
MNLDLPQSYLYTFPNSFMRSLGILFSSDYFLFNWILFAIVFQFSLFNFELVQKKYHKKIHYFLTFFSRFNKGICINYFCFDTMIFIKWLLTNCYNIIVFANILFFYFTKSIFIPSISFFSNSQSKFLFSSQDK